MILVPCLDGQLQDQKKRSLSTSGLFTPKNGHCQQVAFLSGDAYCYHSHKYNDVHPLLKMDYWFLYNTLINIFVYPIMAHI